MHKFTQVFPGVALAFKNLYEVVEKHGICMDVERGRARATIELEEQGMAYYKRYAGPEKDRALIGDMEIVVVANFSNHGFDTDAEDPMVPEAEAEKTARCQARCFLKSYIRAIDCLLAVEVAYNPLSGNGWSAEHYVLCDGKPPSHHVTGTLADHFGFKETTISLSESAALEVVSAMATCFVDQSKRA
jgi:hypothetical protein